MANADRDAHRRRATRLAPREDQLRLMAKVARMYHERGMRQPQIASELHLSQPRISRLLKQATEIGITRTIVVPPDGVYTDLEEDLQRRYGLREVVVVDAEGADDEVIPALGAAAAVYLETTLTGGGVLGISSWSETLLATVEAMRPRTGRVIDEVVQIQGGVGNPRVQVRATRLIGRLAELTGANPIFMPAPGLVGTQEAREALVRDPLVTEMMETWQRLTLALIGVGSLEPSPMLRESGNAITEAEQEELRSLGAVGDICLRFFDRSGQSVHSTLDERVVSINPHQLQEIDRRVAVAGGQRKYSAIRAALLGGWVNVLITDLGVARKLAEEAA